MNATLLARLGLILLVDAIAFRVSYSHIYELALHFGTPKDVALLYPLCVDALILACSLTLIAKSGVSKIAKLYAFWGRAFGFTATVYCNLASSHWASVEAAAFALIPAVSLIIVTELAIHSAKSTPQKRAARTRKASNVTRLRAVGA
jgi:hypothetical protein